MTQELVITRGLPASGKTTWARAWVANDPLRYARVSRDDIRGMLFGATEGDAYRAYFSAPDLHVRESAVSAAEDEAVRGLLENGRNVVVDDTNLRVRYVRKWAELAGDCGASFRIQDFTYVPLDFCLARDEARGWKVGEDVIREMAAKLPSMSKALDAQDDATAAEWRYESDGSKPYAWIVDVDGTLALKGDRSPYDYSRVLQDSPNWPVINVVSRLRDGGEIVVVSGREDVGHCRRDTEEWLTYHGVAYGRLLMRDEGDKRSDEIVKMEILRYQIAPEYDVLGVLDDRNRVVRMWRRVGLTCLQVADGSF